MTTHAAEPPDPLSCHRCGYDLRAQPPEGRCPECGTSVAESKELSIWPHRPAWRESDPRWRRRMLAGLWILVLLPLMDALQASGFASRIPVPQVFDFRGTVRTIDESLVGDFLVYAPLFFCIGIVLLFSNERGRRRNALDWTRRWGILCSYVVFLLGAVQLLFLGSLVLIGIAAVFLSIPLKYQPHTTWLFAEISSGFLRHGAQPKPSCDVALSGFSAIAMLLACIPLFNALSSIGGKRVRVILVAPLVLFSLKQLASVGQYCVNPMSLGPTASILTGRYFRPDVLVAYFAGSPTVPYLTKATFIMFVGEAIKWCCVLGIAIWLSVAQIATWRPKT